MTTLYRAADDEMVMQGMSFAETRETAAAYLANPGFGGRALWVYEVVGKPSVLDLTAVSVADAAQMLGLADPGAIGVDEWLPRDQEAIDAARDRGYLWATVTESYPEETVTWIYLGDSRDLDTEPTGVALD